MRILALALVVALFGMGWTAIQADPVTPVPLVRVIHHHPLFPAHPNYYPGDLYVAPLPPLVLTRHNFYRDSLNLRRYVRDRFTPFSKLYFWFSPQGPGTRGEFRHGTLQVRSHPRFQGRHVIRMTVTNEKGVKVTRPIVVVVR